MILPRVLVRAIAAWTALASLLAYSLASLGPHGLRCLRCCSGSWRLGMAWALRPHVGYREFVSALAVSLGPRGLRCVAGTAWFAMSALLLGKLALEWLVPFAPMWAIGDWFPFLLCR